MAWRMDARFSCMTSHFEKVKTGTNDLLGTVQRMCTCTTVRWVYLISRESKVTLLQYATCKVGNQLPWGMYVRQPMVDCKTFTSID